MPTIIEIAFAKCGFCRKIYCWARTDVYRWWKCWIAQKVFSNKISKKGNTMFLVTGFATVSQIANHCQLSCCIIRFCYSWVNKCDVTRLCQVCTFHDGCKQGIDQQIFNRKSISRKITHPQSWKLQAKLTGEKLKSWSNSREKTNSRLQSKFRNTSS